VNLAQLNWREAFFRLRMVIYVGASAVTLFVSWSERPSVKPALEQCALLLTNHGDKSQEAWCEELAAMTPSPPLPKGFQLEASAPWWADAPVVRGKTGEWEVVDQRALSSEAAALLQVSKNQSLLAAQARHVAVASGWLLAVILAVESAARALLWVLAGLLSSRPRPGEPG
jgi:hypothetical protein